MIQRRPFPQPMAFPFQDRRPRQRVIRSTAQVTWYYLLGLVTVSLLIGLNVFLAGEKALLQQRIDGVRKQCEELEQRNANLRWQYALNTNMAEVEKYAQQQGFVSYPSIVYLDMVEEKQETPARAVTSVSPHAVQGEGDESIWTPVSSLWQTLPQRLQELAPSPRGREVATRR